MQIFFCEVLVEIEWMLLEVMFGHAINRTTTNWRLIVFDFYWLAEFSLLPGKFECGIKLLIFLEIS